jgi:hypothetical protein
MLPVSIAVFEVDSTLSVPVMCCVIPFFFHLHFEHVLAAGLLRRRLSFMQAITLRWI